MLSKQPEIKDTRCRCSYYELKRVSSPHARIFHSRTCPAFSTHFEEYFTPEEKRKYDFFLSVPSGTTDGLGRGSSGAVQRPAHGDRSGLEVGVIDADGIESDG